MPRKPKSENPKTGPLEIAGFVEKGKTAIPFEALELTQCRFINSAGREVLRVAFSRQSGRIRAIAAVPSPDGRTLGSLVIPRVDDIDGFLDELRDELREDA
jgi:hypothetical protein